jgi:integrase
MANRHRRGFGAGRRLPSGRYQASYAGPDGRRRAGATTFEDKAAAERWLAARQDDIGAGTWTPDSGRKAPMVAAGRTVGDYAAGWLAARTLKPRTREHYQRLLDRLILPAFADTPLRTITPDAIRDWHTAAASRTPTLRAHAYSLLRSILNDAVHDGLIPANPAHIRGAGNAKRVHKIKPASLDELTALVDAMPERYRVMTLLAAWCGLRFGELTELRRSDIDLTSGVIRIRRGVVRTDGGYIVGTPKSAAGIRDVAIPPHLIPAVKDHLGAHVNGRAGLLFPAADGISHLAPSTLYKVFYAARAAAGRSDLRFHDLRHTGAVLAASTGATLAELMARLGHSTAGAALRYQHAAAGRDAEIAKRLSALATATAAP